MPPKAALARLAPDLPLLIIGSFRSDEAGDLPSRIEGASSIELPRLDASGVAQLARMMIGPAGAQPAVAEFLHRERLDQLVDNCLRNFRETPKELVTRKEVKIKGEVHREEVSRREILPNPRWYDIAARVVQARRFDS